MRYFKHSFKLLIPVLLAFLLNATTGQAQNLLAFTPNGFSGWPDSIPRGGDTVTVGGWLKNYSPDSAFQDYLYIEGTVDTGAGPISFSYDFSFLQPTFQLAPGEQLHERDGATDAELRRACRGSGCALGGATCEHEHEAEQ